MDGQDERRCGWATGFVPGLVMGLVIGAFVGAVLPPLLSANKLPDRAPGATTSAGDRDHDEIRDEGRRFEERPTDESMPEASGQTGIPEDADLPAETDETQPTEGEMGDDDG
ncbi:hypothetical protein MNBD_PLANCTO03-1849 [hydrothermal vent metagenome]|uniref:Uncharacterized protein n=1 Tax=hydrothermal vent metagenome TaxID=652676 RepID=A0A3B1DKE5_9ZZZZ